MNSIAIVIDDERTFHASDLPAVDEVRHFRTTDEAINLIVREWLRPYREYGHCPVYHFYLDHDMGIEDIRIVINLLYKILSTTFYNVKDWIGSFNIHTQNPVGAQWIEEMLKLGQMAGHGEIHIPVNRIALPGA